MTVRSVCMTWRVPAPDELGAAELAALELAPAGSLRFGDRLPYFGQHVRSVQEHGNPDMVELLLLPRLGCDRVRLTCYRSDRLHVLRTGWMLGGGI